MNLIHALAFLAKANTLKKFHPSSGINLYSDTPHLTGEKINFPVKCNLSKLLKFSSFFFVQSLFLTPPPPPQLSVDLLSVASQDFAVLLAGPAHIQSLRRRRRRHSQPNHLLMAGVCNCGRIAS